MEHENLGVDGNGNTLVLAFASIMAARGAGSSVVTGIGGSKADAVLGQFMVEHQICIGGRPASDWEDKRPRL